jgi:cell division septation protein DedD
MLQRVQIGPFPSEEEAAKLKDTLIELGFTGHRIVTR